MNAALYMLLFLTHIDMSRSKAKLATIHDLQCQVSNCTLTKRDLEFIVRGLRTLDKSKFTEREVKEHESLTLYFSHLTYGK